MMASVYALGFLHSSAKSVSMLLVHYLQGLSLDLERDIFGGEFLS